MTETIEFFRMTDRQKKAWVAIMGNANFPTSLSALMRGVHPMWNSIREHDPLRAFELFEDAQALRLYDAANDAVFGIDWDGEQT